MNYLQGALLACLVAVGGGRALAAGQTVTVVSVDATATGGVDNSKEFDVIGRAVIAGSSSPGEGSIATGEVRPQNLVADTVAATEAVFSIQVAGTSLHDAISGFASAQVVFSCTGPFSIETETQILQGQGTIELDGHPLNGFIVVAAGSHTLRMTGVSTAINFNRGVLFTILPSEEDPDPDPDPEPAPSAGDLHWKLLRDGAWGTPANWKREGVPGPQSRVFLDPPSSGLAIYDVSSDRDRVVRQMFVRRSSVRLRGFEVVINGVGSARSLEVGQAGVFDFAASRLETQGTTLIGAAPRVRNLACAMFLRDVATWQLNGDLVLGETNEGKLDVLDSKLLGATGVRIGAKKATLGRLSCGSSRIELGEAVIGAASGSSGALDVEGASTVLANSMLVAAAAKSIGTVTLKGGATAQVSPTLTIAGALGVGGVAAGGVGKLTIGPGATVHAASVSVGKGRRKGAKSSIEVVGSGDPAGPQGTLLVTGTIEVGPGGPAELQVSDGFVNAADVRIGGLGVIRLSGVEGGDPASVPSFAVSGALTIDGNAGLDIGLGSFTVSGTATIGGTARGTAVLVLFGRDGVTDPGFVAGSIVLGGTTARARGDCALAKAKIQAGSVLVRPTGELRGDGTIVIVPGAGALFRNEGLVSVDAGSPIDILGDFDLEATGRVSAGYIGSSPKDIAPLLVDAEFVKLAGTLEVVCQDFDPVQGDTFRVLEGIGPFTVTSLPADLRTRVLDKKGRIRPSHAVVFPDHVNVIVD